MAASATHKGWRYSPNNGILSAIYTGAKGGASALAANTALAGLFLGTPVVNALAVDSIVVSNLVASGDFMVALNRGGNSEAYVFADASAGTLYLYAPNGAITLTPSTDLVLANGTGLIVGATTQVTTSNGDGATDMVPEFQVLGTLAADGSVLVATFNTTNTRAVSPHIALVKGAAATQVATTAVADNEVVGSIIAYGSDGTDFETPVAAIEFVVDDSGGPGTGAIGGSIEFYTTADGGETLTIALTLSTAQLATFAAGIQGNTRVDVGITGTTTGIVAIDGAATGTVSMTVAAAAGTWTLTLPATAGEAGDGLVSDGTGISSWVSGMRSVDVQLTNAQLMALLGTDITLVAAPGANRAIVVHAIYMFFDVTTTAYTLGSAALAVGYGGDGADIAAITEAGFLDTATDAGRWYQIGAAAATPAIITPVANQTVVMRATVADMTGGNAANTLSVRVYYSVVDYVAFT